MLARSLVSQLFLLFVALLLTTACASSPPPKPVVAAKTTAWRALLVDDTSDPQIRIRPRAASEDAVFGPLLRRAEREAAGAIGNVLVGQSALQVFERSEMVTIAARHVRPLDAVVIFAGVPGSIAPESMVDGSGRALWKKVDAHVRGTEEYVRLATAEGGRQETVDRMRLVVVGGSTWVMAFGPAVDRMFSAFAIGAPDALHPDVGPLAEIIAVGELLDAAKRGRFPNLHEVLGPLERADLTLEGGTKKPDAKAVLTFTSVDAAARGEDFVSTMLRIFKEKWPKHRGLLAGITVSRAERKVTVDAPVPPLVVEMLVDAEKPATAL